MWTPSDKIENNEKRHSPCAVSHARSGKLFIKKLVAMMLSLFVAIIPLSGCSGDGFSSTKNITVSDKKKKDVNVKVNRPCGDDASNTAGGHSTWSGGTITVADLQACKSQQELIDLLGPCFQFYCEKYGLRFGGVFTCQTWHETCSLVINGGTSSSCLMQDNNCSGLKFTQSMAELTEFNITGGSKYPESGGSGVYARFESIDKYIEYAMYMVAGGSSGESLYKDALALQDKTPSEFCPPFTGMWVNGDINSPGAYCDQLIKDYDTFNASRYDNPNWSSGAKTQTSSSGTGSISSSSSGGKSAGCSLEKDGYKIPMPCDENGNESTDESRRGIGYWGVEQHLTGSLKSGESHKTDSEWYTDNGDAGSGSFSDATAEEEEWYCCMRWQYVTWNFGTSKQYSTNGRWGVAVTGTSNCDSEQMSWTRKQRVAIRNPQNDRVVVCSIIESGPGPSERIGGLSPEAYNYLTNNGQEQDPDIPTMECLGWCDDENQPLGPTNDITSGNKNKEECEKTTGKSFTDSGIEGALQWMKAGCDDDTVGYSQPRRTTVKDYDGKKKVDADCASYVYYALVVGGGFSALEQACSSAFDTTDMGGYLESCGWKKYDYKGDSSVLKRGDIMWRSGHTEFYFGEDNTGGAHWDENKGTDGPSAGDQTGSECSVAEPNSGTKSFTHYFRYEGK